MNPIKKIQINYKISSNDQYWQQRIIKAQNGRLHNSLVVSRQSCIYLKLKMVKKYLGLKFEGHLILPPYS